MDRDCEALLIAFNVQFYLGSKEKLDVSEFGVNSPSRQKIQKYTAYNLKSRDITVYNINEIITGLRTIDSENFD